MQLGCGRPEDRHGQAQAWQHGELAEAIRLSDQRMIYAYLKEGEYPSSSRFPFLLDAFSPNSEKQCRAVEALKRAFEGRPKRRRQRKAHPSTTPDFAPLPPIPADARPYRGLETFGEEDAHLFFGRDALAQNVLGKLDHHRLVLLVGASGSGKSSLINAGILAKLRQDPGRTIVRCIPGDRAIANLAAALTFALEPDRSPAELLPTQQSYKAQLEADRDAIRDIAQLLPNGRLLLVIDQFEETFTLTRPANPKQHDALIATLLAIARSPDERKLEALLGMRSDFMNELETADPHLVQALDNASVQMRAMFPDELEDAITGPLQPYGVTLEPGLLPGIAADLKGNPDALPLLEVALEELWQQRDEPNRLLTKAAYAEIGGITGALARRADHALEQLGLDETTIRRLFLELVRVDPEGAATKSTRRPRTKTELDPLDPDLWPLGQKLATPKIRLLVTRRDETSGEETLDITHESLLRQWQRLADWIEDEREFLLFAQRLDQRLAEFTDSGENPDYLLPKTDVQAVQAWQTSGKIFRPDQQSYIARSTAFWAEDASDDAARALWGRLDLLFSNHEPIPEHELGALGSLPWCNVAIRRRFLKLAVTNPDVARKLNRQPGLVIRATLGIDPNSALNLAKSILENSAESRNIELTLAWVIISVCVSPMLPSVALGVVERSQFIAAHTIDKTILKMARESIDSVAHLVEENLRSNTKKAICAQSKGADELILNQNSEIDPKRSSSTLQDRIYSIINLRSHKQRIEKLFYLIANTTDPYLLSGIFDCYDTISEEIDEPVANHVASLVISILNKIHEAVQIQVVARAATVIADKLDPATRRKAIEAIYERLSALVISNSDPSQFAVMSEVIDDIARWLTEEERSNAADKIVNQLLDALDGEKALWEIKINDTTRIVRYLEECSEQKRKITATRAIRLAAFRPSRTFFCAHFY